MEEKVIGIAGNPNTGKTTIFNALTGTRQQVGNWPGVTVEKKEGYYIYKGIKFNIIDLPGTYTLSAESEDQKIAVDFLSENKVDVLLLISDATNLERSLYFLILLSELHKNIIVDLNMVDLAEKEGIDYDIEHLEKLLKIKFVKTIGNRNVGIDELKEAIYEKCKEQISEDYIKFKYGDEVEKVIFEIEKELKPIFSNYPLRFLAIKILEKDEYFVQMAKDKIDYSKIEEIILNLEKKLGRQIESILIEKRYAIIHGIVREAIIEKKKEIKIELTEKIDKILTNNFSGPLIFLLIMFFIFNGVFILGKPIQDFLEIILENLKNVFIKFSLPLWLNSLIKDGVISGVGSVILFIPNIFLFFLFFSILEDTGYIARATIVSDRLMHKIGLHGKSAISMILGFGCNVPAIMGTRILENKRDKILTCLSIPFMSCSARLPVYLLFTSLFFKEKQGLIIFSLYLLGIIVGVLSIKFFSSVFLKQESLPLIIELPPFRMPYWKNVFIESWIRTKYFLKKAGSIIFIGALVLWFLSYFPHPNKYGTEFNFIGKLGSFIAPLFKFSGFGFWQAGVALIFGIYAKELVVATFGTLFGIENLSGILTSYFTFLSAYSFMIMSLLYMPCLATFLVLKKEIGIKWALISLFWSLFIGWFVSTLLYQVFTFLRGG
ncbi:MAG: ferrous iron transport protein B [Candidatus Omnitrophica bacterium]|nr:ferrous iron transport protein B [Candidatus Omnitrophota bacterium]